MSAGGYLGLPRRIAVGLVRRAGDSRGRQSRAGWWAVRASRPAPLRFPWARIGLFILTLLAAAGAHAQSTPGGTLITNRAAIAYTGISGSSEVAYSNTFDLVTSAVRTSAQIALTRVTAAPPVYTEPVGPAACSAGGVIAPLAAPVLLGRQPIDPDTPQTLIEAATFHRGEPVFVRLADADRNVDAAVRDFVAVTFRVAVTGDVETVRLTETSADSGVFAGYVPTGAASAGAGDCVLATVPNAAVQVDYVDADDPSDRAAALARLDPVSRVFDARSGAPVSGARVTLIDVATGQQALVYGDDGASAFPATLVSGAQVSDASGATYAFGPGEFRFPVVPAGRYRLEVEAPAGYTAPSQRTELELQALPGAPFVLSGASFGGPFDSSADGVAPVDVPLDPAAGTLLLEKRATASLAAVGDFIEFRLALRHADGAAAAKAVAIEDRLPAGLRYLPGSARVLGDRRLEPALSADGRSLTFELGAVAPGSNVELSYVAVVIPGVQLGEIVNVARAVGLDAESNEARAAVKIVDDLNAHESFLVGRVALGACSAAESGDGLAGARVYLEDGRYAVSDEGGRFHFEGLPPGGHVVQLDVDSLPPSVEVVPCNGDTRFAGSAFSRFVELRAGALGRADFYVRRTPPPSGRATLSLEQALEGDTFAYRLDAASDAALHLDAAQVLVMLPPGFALEPGSARTEAGEVDVRQTDDVLTFDLGARDGPWREVLNFHARAAHTPAEARLDTRALLKFRFEGSARQTPVATTAAAVVPASAVAKTYVLQVHFPTLSAQLAPVDRAVLDALVNEWSDVADVRLEAVGHSDAQPFVPGKNGFADNYELSSARAAAVAEYLRGALGLGSERVTYRGVGPDQPVARNDTAAGRGANRRVELSVAGSILQRAQGFAIERAASEVAAVALAARSPALPAMTVGRADPPPEEPAAAPDFDADALAPEFAWLSPTADAAPAIPSLKVAIQHAATQQVALALNGQPVSELNFDGTDFSADRRAALSRWRGVDLIDGPNTLAATVVDAAGREQTFERRVHFAGPPVRGEIVAERSVLTADGAQRPVIAVRLVDRWGEPARAGTVGEFSVGAPYRSWFEVERLRENPVLITGERSPAYRVGADGVALIELEPTTRTGEVVLTLRYPRGEEQQLRAWLEPAPRDWILVGFAEGTVGYNRLRGSLENAEAGGYDADYYDAGRLAFFAKGQVKGALLTLALDSAGKSERPTDAFGGVIEPDRYYTLYGDNTEQRYDAPSRERLYVKIERDTFMALYGDYETGLTVSELGRYNRSFTGFKSERHGTRFSYSAFAAQSAQAFVKDELRGDGTSGPYRLSRRTLTAGSDKLELQVRDRFRPELTLSSRPLRRHFDYDIDYLTGTLNFKEPIPSRDFGFNPVYIVADYESQDGNASGVLAGGRGAVRLAGDRAELGLTLIRDGTAGAGAELAATDLRYRLTSATELKAEIATSTNEAGLAGGGRGSAYRVELTQQSERRELQAYVRETDAAFGLGQQSSTEQGTRRTGVALRNELNANWLLQAEGFRQESLRDGALRTVVEGETRYEDTRRALRSGLRRVDEELPAQHNEVSQAFAGGSWRFFGDTLTTRMNVETDLTATGASADYPQRTILGVDIAVGPAVSLYGEHELAQSDRLDARTTRFGVKASPGQRTEIDSSLNETFTEYGPRTYAALGLSRGFRLGSQWTLDLGAERTATLREADLQPLDPRVPLASGSLGEDFSSGFLGAGYRAEDWSFASRLEYRDGERDRRRALIAGLYRERVAGRGFSAELHLLDALAVDRFASFDGWLRLGWAYRPDDSRWILFERVDWGSRRNLAGDGRADGRRLVSNFNAHWLASTQDELALQYAAKYVRYDSADWGAHSFVDLFGADWRRQLNDKLDLGLHGSWYGARIAGASERGFGVDVGFGVARNLRLSVGYNFLGFEDADFTQARYTAEGPFVTFRLKVDQASLQDLLRR